MDVALSHSGCGDLDEFRFLLHVLDSFAACIPHSSLEPGGHHLQDVGNTSFVRNDALDSFRSDLGFGGEGVQKIPVPS